MMSGAITAADILDALIARADDVIWASEVEFDGRSSRLDFWTLHPHSRHVATAYEIKISRSDFSRDSEEKQRDAIRFSNRFFYVAPVGILNAIDVPDWAGLMTWDGVQFRIPKKAPMRHKAAPDWGLIVSVLRNSRDCRRDTEYLRVQLAAYKQIQERQKRIDRHRLLFEARRMGRRYGRPDGTIAPAGDGG